MGPKNLLKREHMYSEETIAGYSAGDIGRIAVCRHRVVQLEGLFSGDWGGRVCNFGLFCCCVFAVVGNLFDG